MGGTALGLEKGAQGTLCHWVTVPILPGSSRSGPPLDTQKEQCMGTSPQGCDTKNLLGITGWSSVIKLSSLLKPKCSQPCSIEFPWFTVWGGARSFFSLACAAWGWTSLSVCFLSMGLQHGQTTSHPAPADPPVRCGRSHLKADKMPEQGITNQRYVGRCPVLSRVPQGGGGSTEHQPRCSQRAGNSDLHQLSFSTASEMHIRRTCHGPVPELN